jgi:hypothetical protein
METDFVPPTIDSVFATMILLCEHPAAAPVRKWKTGFSFSKRAARLLHRRVWMRERPINTSV